MAAAGCPSLVVTWWSSSLDKVSVEDYPRLGSLMFDARGVVPAGYAAFAFAFALGVTVGMTVPISEAVVDSLMRDPTTGSMRIEGKAPAGAWLLSSRTVDGSGNAVESIPMSLTSGPCKPSGMPGEGMERCFAEIERLGYRQQLSYHAASRFWPFQWVETGLYGAGALLLGGFCFWWVRRRLS